MVKDNKLISQKSFGKLSYDENSRAVDNSTIYDIASITKVLSVTPIAMKLIDQRKLSLEHTLEQYYPSLYGKPNGKITIKHLLTHSSGLKPFIEFYKQDPNMQKEQMLNNIFSTSLDFNPGEDSGDFDSDSINSFDFQGTAGVEYKFPSGFFIQGRYSYGFSEMIEDVDVHNSVWSAGLGFMF